MIAFTTVRIVRSTVAGACAAAIITASLLSACGEDSAGQGEDWRRQGQLLAWDRDVWIVDAVPIVVPSSLNVDDQRTLGSQVNAAGSYDEQGRMVAHSVTLTNGSLPDATLEAAVHEGAITSVSDSIWVVDGMAILLSDGVTIIATEGVDPASLASPGNIASVTGFRFGDGTIIATEIALREAPREADTNAAPHPAAPVERPPEQPQPPDRGAPEPEPDPAPPANRDDGDDDDDDDDERGNRDWEKQQEREEKDREKQEKRDEQERRKQEKQREKDEKGRKRSMSPLEPGVSI